ncbi:hypothetical protein V9T40_011153 [Parthenolecanium corni]|uniref:Phospholipase B1, membrane-associated n=1 Tax=Parthenolecanium corni TaxID=536013 RepID=A0AAN9T4W0_9HEMI
MKMLTFASTLLVWLEFGAGDAAWYHTLPDERFEGVPSIVLRLEKNYPAIKKSLLKLIGKTGHSKRNVNEARSQRKTQPYMDEVVPYPCNVSTGRSKTKPTTAHAVRPGDIDLVAAMGDSLTAGSGAYAVHLFHIATENRGVASFIGGQGTWREHLTIPNMLKEFNPNLIGYSLGDSYTYHKESQFNIAELAAMGQDMPYMAQQLVKRIQNDPRVDMKNDWKLVTLLIGSNNFCSDICYLKNSSTAIENHRRGMIKTFRYLQHNMPRTIINWIQSPNLKLLTNFIRAPPKCHLMHRLECPCLFSDQFKHRRNEFFSTMLAWQKMEEEVAYDKEFQSKDDFTIVLQSCLKKLTAPTMKDETNGQIKTDISYFSFDCFHLSQKGYSRVTNAIWNNLLEPVGSKAVIAEPEFKKFSCPSEKFPYIYTWKNSQIKYETDS